MVQLLNLHLHHPHNHPSTHSHKSPGLISTSSTLHRLDPPANHFTPSDHSRTILLQLQAQHTIPKEDPALSASSCRCAQAVDGSCRCRRKRKFARPQHLEKTKESRIGSAITTEPVCQRKSQKMGTGAYLVFFSGSKAALRGHPERKRELLNDISSYCSFVSSISSQPT